MDNNTKPKSNPPQRQLPAGVAAILLDQEEFYRRLEAAGCPPAEVAGFRRATSLALAQTLAESKRRNFLLDAIKHRVQKLKPERLFSGFPAGSPKVLDEIENLALQLRDEDEKQIVLRRVKQIQKCLPEGCEI